MLVLVERREVEVITVPTAGVDPGAVGPGTGQVLEVDGRPLVHNVRRPTLAVRRPDAAASTRAGIVICPGGGYRYLVAAHEGSDLAAWCVEHGLVAFVLRYRLLPTSQDPQQFACLVAREGEAGEREALLAAMPAHEPVAAADGRRAIRLIRERAPAWGLDPHRLAMLGFSAGGRVALQAAVSPRPEERPDAVAAVYAPDRPPFEVPLDAPPLLVVAAADDRVVPGAGPRLAARWEDARRPVELHVYPDGGHGFGLLPRGTTSDACVEGLEAWLRKQQLLA